MTSNTRNIMMAVRYFLISDDYGCSAGGHHEHRAIGSDGLVVDVDAYNGIGSKSLGTLHHLLHGRILGLDKYFLVRTAAAAEKVGETSYLLDVIQMQKVAGLFHISIVSPSLLISQKGISFSSVNSFIRHEDSKPLATKCMGTKRPTLNRSMNCRPPRV